MEYKKFNQTRREIIILDEWVEMVWSSSIRERYEELGYEYTGYLNKFFVHIDDLAYTSGAYVNIECPVCHESRVARRNQVHYTGHTLCRRCSKLVDVTGMKFGRWTAIECAETVNDHAYWLCLCECGEERLVDVHSLKNGCSTSCGCYQKELMSEKRGNNSPVWVDPIILACEQCGNEYEARDSWDAKNRRFCSVECYGDWVSENKVGENSVNWKGGNVVLNCEWCGNEFSVSQARSKEAKFCSRECVGKWRSENVLGELHPNWDFTLTDEQRYNNRSSLEYKKYIQNVLKRDDYTCQACGVYGVPMDVHHLYSHNNYPEYALDENFGITLCKEHHKAFHSWLGGYGVACIPSDFDRWMYATS